MGQHTPDFYPICPVGSQTNMDETVIGAGQNSAAQAPVYSKGNLWAVQPSGKTDMLNTLEDDPSGDHNCEVYIHGYVVASERTLIEKNPAHYVDRGDDTVEGSDYVTYTIRCVAP